MLSTRQCKERLDQRVRQPVEAPENYCGSHHHYDGDESVVGELLAGRPNDLLQLALHLAEPLADSPEEAGLGVVVLLNGGDCLCGGSADFLFVSHFHASFQKLLSLNVLGVLSAEGAIFAALQTVRSVLLVLDRVVVPLLAFFASECDFTLAPAAILSAPPILFTRIAGIASLYCDEGLRRKMRAKTDLSSDR